MLIGLICSRLIEEIQVLKSRSKGGMILSFRGSLVAQLNAIAIHGDVYGYFGHADLWPECI